MSGNLSTAFANDVCDMLTGRTPAGGLGNATACFGGSLYIALTSDNPVDGDSTIADVTELSGNGYSRIALTSTIFSTGAASGAISNVTTGISWTASGGTLGGAAVQGWVITDGATAGVTTDNIVAWCDDPAGITVADGETLTFAASGLTIDVHN